VDRSPVTFVQIFFLEATAMLALVAAEMVVTQWPSVNTLHKAKIE
jgi:hypothetical protein